jgi:hypothetical protein
MITTYDKRTPVTKFRDIPNGSLFSLWDDFDEHDDGGVYVKLNEGIVMDAEVTDFEYNTFDVSDCVLRHIDDNASVILINEVELTILQ